MNELPAKYRRDIPRTHGSDLVEGQWFLGHHGPSVVHRILVNPKRPENRKWIVLSLESDGRVYVIDYSFSASDKGTKNEHYCSFQPVTVDGKTRELFEEAARRYDNGVRYNYHVQDGCFCDLFIFWCDDELAYGYKITEHENFEEVLGGDEAGYITAKEAERSGLYYFDEHENKLEEEAENERGFRRRY